MTSKGWSTFNKIAAGIGAVAALLELFTSGKAQDYDDNRMYEEMEDRYLLVKKDKKKEEH